MGGVISHNDLGPEEFLTGGDAPTQPPVNNPAPTIQQNVVAMAPQPQTRNVPQQPPQNIEANTTQMNSVKPQQPQNRLQGPNAPIHRTLLESCVNGNLQQLQWCVQNGGNIEVTDKDGNTPLFYASDKGFIEIVKCLIASRAQQNRKNKVRQTPHSLTRSGRICSNL